MKKEIESNQSASPDVTKGPQTSARALNFENLKRMLASDKR